LESKPSIEISRIFNSVTWESTIPTSGRNAILGFYAQGLSERATLETVRIHVGSYGTLPIYIGDSQFEGHKQINATVPSGLEPGEQSLWIEDHDQRSNQRAFALTEGTEW
jgi:uncharacterized protein (TIGR03437 family)